MLRAPVEQAAQFRYPVLWFSPAERTVVRCSVETEYSTNPRYLLETVFKFAETLLQFDAAQTQGDVHLPDVSVRTVRGGGYVRVHQHAVWQELETVAFAVCAVPYRQMVSHIGVA